MGGITRRARAAVVAASVATLLLAGCTSEQGSTTVTSGTTNPVGSSASSSSGTATAPATSTIPAGEPTVTAVPSITADQQQSTPAPSPSGSLRAAVVKEIRTGRHAGFDRVVIEFQGAPGTWRTSYQNEVLEDPTGNKLPVQGNRFLVVVVQNATFDNAFQTDASVPHASYAGARAITPTGLGNVRQIVRAGDFEATLSLAVGLDKQTGVRVQRLDGPARLVIDIAN